MGSSSCTLPLLLHSRKEFQLVAALTKEFLLTSALSKQFLVVAALTKEFLRIAALSKEFLLTSALSKQFLVVAALSKEFLHIAALIKEFLLVAALSKEFLIAALSRSFSLQQLSVRSFLWVRSFLLQQLSVRSFFIQQLSLTWGSKALRVRVRSAQWAYWHRGQDLWLETGRMLQRLAQGNPSDVFPSIVGSVGAASQKHKNTT